MKIKLLLILVLITQITLAQQVTLMQPALRDSDKNIIKHEYYTTDIDTNIEHKLYQILFIDYDTEKNPTESTIDIFDEDDNIISTGNSDNSDVDYYPIDEYHIEGAYSIVNNLFPTKNSDINLVNPNTSELYNLFHFKYNKDGRFSILQHNEAVWDYLEYQHNEYDGDFNITGGSKDEITMQGDLPVERLTYIFNETTSIFEPDFKEIYYNTFDNGVLTERIVKKVTNFTTNVEENYMKETFIFTSNTFERQFFSWDTTSNNWQLEWNLITIYNANNQPLSYTYSNWNESTSSWDLNTEYIYNYNALDLLETYERTGFYNDVFSFTYNSDNLLTEINHVYYENGILQSNVRNTFYYEPETASINETNTSIINIYPNPTNKVLNIDLESDFEYQIYSIQGKLLKNGVANKQIQVSDLEKGIYFIHIKTANLEEKQKFVVN